ncbi:TlpA family protein disulfide reductase [Flavobacterium sp. UBA4197]|uniref:TlpA family protein disulfide reductase n=1 Tax=Flavobacterium sp. UBA4197 TaxID=1946546 RepID=UPI0025797CDD|nr:TlpA family protein disulfide reductase [Flavobacterium sp. UBA4197]
MKKIIIMLAVFSFISCKKEVKTEEKAVTEAAAATPKPLKIYEKDRVKVKSFDFNGLEPLLKKDNDTTYVVNFWATWCVPCVAELPHFEKLNADYKDKKVKVLLVSLDMPQKVESNLLPFIKKKNMQSEIVYLNDPDANAWISKVDTAWSGAIPATVIYKGDKRKFFEQSFTYEALQKELQSIMN